MNSRLLRVCLLLVCCVAARFLPAQELLRSQYYINHMDITSGLPHNNVSQLFVDSQGFMWIATYGGGAVRYDGYAFVSPVDDGDMPFSNSCRAFAEDRFQRLWIAYDEGVTVLDLATMRNVVPATSDGSIARQLRKQTVKVYCDSEGALWHVTVDSIFRYTFDDSGSVVGQSCYRYTRTAPDVSLSDIERNGTVWCNIDGGVYRLSERQGRLLRQTISPVLHQIDGAFVTDYVKKEHTVWIASNQGLYAYDLSNGSLRSYRHTAHPQSLAHDYATSLAVSDSGHLLVGTLRGLDVLESHGDGFEHWNTATDKSPLPSDFIHCVLLANNQIWLGTETAGIVKLSRRPFFLRSYTHDARQESSLSANLVNSMYVDAADGLWVGTVEGGLNRQTASGSFEHWNTHNSPLSHNSVSVLQADSAGHLWIGTWGGGLNVMPADGRGKPAPVAVDAALTEKTSHIGSMAYDHRNQLLWIGANAGIFVYNLRNGQMEIPFAGSDAIRGCIGTHIDRHGQLWMGCITGVCVVDLRAGRRRDGSFRYRHLLNKLDNPQSRIVDKISCFCETRDGTLWLGSSSYGLYRRVVDAKSGQEHFESLTTEHGLANNSVKGIVEDAQGRLWITTANGLSLYDVDTRTFTNYDEQDGLPCSQFYWNSAIRGKNGAIYLGSTNGLIEVMGDNIADISPSVHLVFTRLMVNNQLVTADNGDIIDADITRATRIRLHESDKSLVIDFSALTFTDEIQGHYSYRLKGFEDEWTMLRPGEHAVRYTSLPAGHYTFEVKFSTKSKTEKTYEASVDITVQPYFWKSWWFMLLVVFVVGFALNWFSRYRMAKWRKQEAEKMLQPIRKALEESEAPEELQLRIQNILNVQKRITKSHHQILEKDKQQAPRHRDFMERAMQILENHYADSTFGIAEFADAIGMSKSLLSKKLNEEAGVSTGQFIRNYRLSVARKMILENPANRNITEIAYQVGFNDPKYFTRCFTHLYGSSPSTYKPVEDSG